jgi:hypothetical protein
MLITTKELVACTKGEWSTRVVGGTREMLGQQLFKVRCGGKA